jgi:hypothetical protein
MQYVQTNTAQQQLLLTLKEGALLLGEAYTNYLVKLTHDATSKVYRCIPIVASEDARITQLVIDTNVDDAENGGILMIDPGRYSYEIYAQNSDTNLDESLSIGMVEKGWIEANSSQIYYSSPTINIPEDKIYNG